MRRVLALIICLGAWPFMGGLTGCAGHRSNPITGQHVDDPRSQSTDQHIEDHRTAERVREDLAASPKYRYEGVQVAVLSGVVHLSGFVNTKAQKSTAEEITAKLAGVRSVENSIVVKD